MKLLWLKPKKLEIMKGKIFLLFIFKIIFLCNHNLLQSLLKNAPIIVHEDEPKM